MQRAYNSQIFFKLFWLLIIPLTGCTEPQNKSTTLYNAPRNLHDPNSPNLNTSDSHVDSKLDLFFNSAERDLNALPQIVADETWQLFSDRKHWLPLSIVGAASIVMHNSNIDKEIAESCDLHRALSTDVDEFVSNIGGPGVHFGAAGLWYALSASEQNEFQKQRAWTMIQALSVNGAVTLGLKLVRNNRTPNEKWLAWPSGHTSSSFTVASVLDEFYGPEVGVPAYLGAGFVGYRMMDSGDHWASDVVFGAVLGYLIGHQIAEKHQDVEIAGFKVAPYISPDAERPVVGLTLTKKF